VAEAGGAVAAGLDELEADLWRRGLDVAAVDGVLALVRRLLAASGAVGGSQGSGGTRGGERLSEGVGWGGVEPRPEPVTEPGPELAGKQAGSAGVARGTSGTAVPLTRGRVSTEPAGSRATGAVKACGVCRLAQPLEEFYRDGNKPDGRRATCKTCERTRRALRQRELATVRRLVREGGDPTVLLAAIEERATAERELRQAARRATRVGPDGRRVTPALDAATLAVVLAAPR